MQNKIEVGLLGATGMVGQQFVNQLEGHPWFELTWLGASERSAGKTYAEAATWVQDRAMPQGIAARTVWEAKPVAEAPRLMFSAMDASVASEIEQAFAKAGHVVVSNSRNHRMFDDVPLLIPEVNAEHLRLIERQRAERGWSGAIVTNPNCSTITMALALGALKPFGIEKILATTMQAISGAGYPGLPSADIVANVIPYIGNEEEKMESETQKILGEMAGGRVEPLAAAVSAHCNRVQVLDGHTVAVSVGLADKPGVEALKKAFADFRGVPQEKRLPTAPARPIHVMTQPDRPQPRRDLMTEGGMSVCVGRVRECKILDYKFVALGHNTIRGAAGAAVLNAELLKTEGWLD